MTDDNDSSRSDRKSNSTSDTNNSQPTRNHVPPFRADSTRKSRVNDSRNGSFTRSQWEDIPSDPDIRADFGYEVTRWETIDTATDSNQIIFMPQNEELIKDDAFIVANESDLCDLGKNY
jgi:hypothetical protein